MKSVRKLWRRLLPTNQLKKIKKVGGLYHPTYILIIYVKFVVRKGDLYEFTRGLAGSCKILAYVC